MPRGANPYFADAGRSAPIGQAIGNLGQMFMASQDPTRRAAALSSAWDARNSREQVTDRLGARTGRANLGDIFSSYTPETGLPDAQVMGEAIRSGAFSPEDLGALFQVASGNLPGMSDERRAGAYVGAGNAIQPDDAFSIAGRDVVAGRNQGYTMDQQGLVGDQAMARLRAEQGFKQDNPNLDGMTVDETIAYLFMEGKPEEAQALADTRGYGINSGNQPDPYLQATRQSDLQEQLMGEVTAQLSEQGVPLDAEGNVRTDLLPPDLLSSVMDTAWTRMQSDIESGQPTRAMSAYVGDALQQQGVTGFDYTEDNSLMPFFGEEELTPRAAPAQPEQPAQATGNAPEVGYTFTDEQGVTYIFRGGNPNDPNAWEPQS